MADEIVIKPEHVKTAGSTVATEAGEARAAVALLFDSAGAAAMGNRGFATGPKLVAYNDDLQTDFTTAVSDLEATGNEIVRSAQLMQVMDAENAEGLSRVATALNGLGGDPLPG